MLVPGDLSMQKTHPATLYCTVLLYSTAILHYAMLYCLCYTVLFCAMQCQPLLYYTVLHCYTILYSIMLLYIIPYAMQCHTILYYTAMLCYSTILCCYATVLHYTIPYHTIPLCYAVLCHPCHTRAEISQWWGTAQRCATQMGYRSAGTLLLRHFSLSPWCGWAGPGAAEALGMVIFAYRQL